MQTDVTTVSPWLRAFLLVLRRWIRAMQTPKPEVSAIERLVRSAIMLPAFSLVFAVLKVRGSRRGLPTFVAETATGDRFMCRPPDLVQMYVWLFGVWEPDLTEFIRRALGRGDTFIDVGANIGVFSVLASRCVGVEGAVVAIEASPVVFGDLEQSLRLNGSPVNVRAAKVAASDSEASIPIYSGPAENTGLTTTIESRGFVRQAMVPAKPLSAILTDREVEGTRLIKIDVEGAEPAVIAGMGQIPERCRRDAEILIELSPHWWKPGTPKPSVVLEPLLRAGFHPYRIDNNYWPWRYAYPRCVRRPRRIRQPLDAITNRVDLVLSRRDEELL